MVPVGLGIRDERRQSMMGELLGLEQWFCRKYQVLSQVSVPSRPIYLKNAKQCVKDQSTEHGRDRCRFHLSEQRACISQRHSNADNSKMKLEAKFKAVAPLADSLPTEFNTVVTCATQQAG